MMEKKKRQRRNSAMMGIIIRFTKENLSLMPSHLTDYFMLILSLIVFML